MLYQMLMLAITIFEVHSVHCHCQKLQPTINQQFEDGRERRKPISIMFIDTYQPKE